LIFSESANVSPGCMRNCPIIEAVHRPARPRRATIQGLADVKPHIGGARRHRVVQRHAAGVVVRSVVLDDEVVDAVAAGIANAPARPW